MSHLFGKGGDVVANIRIESMTNASSGRASVSHDPSHAFSDRLADHVKRSPLRLDQTLFRPMSVLASTLALASGRNVGLRWLGIVSCLYVFAIVLVYSCRYVCVRGACNSMNSIPCWLRSASFHND